MNVLLRIGEFTLTGYGLCLLGGAAAGILLSWLRKKDILPALLPVLLGAVLMGHVCWVLFCPKVFADEKMTIFLQFWKGGYTMYGALIGGTLGALLGARMISSRPAEVLDAVAPGACAVIFMGRIGDYLSGQGFGNKLEGMELKGLRFFPVSYVTYADEYAHIEEWSYAVWAWEALAALILLLVLLVRFRKAPAGRTFAAFVIGLGSSQIVLEQARRDSFVNLNPFVRFTQIAAAMTLLALLVYLALKYRPGKAKTALTFAAFGAAVAALVFAEFVFDKFFMAWMLYLSQAAAGVLMYFLLKAARGEGGKQVGALYCGFCFLLVLLHFLTGRGNGNLLLFGMMIVSSAGLAMIASVNLPKETGEVSPSAN